MRTTLLKAILTLQFSCLLARPEGLHMGGRGGTPGQTHLTSGNSNINDPDIHKNNDDKGNIIEHLSPRKEYRKISVGPSYPIKRQDFYNFNNDYDYPQKQEEDPRHLSQDSIKRPDFKIPNDFKSNFGNFDEFLKSFDGSNKGFAHFLNSVNLNSFRVGSGGFAGDATNQKHGSQQQQQDYGYQPDEKPTFTRPEPVYIPKEEGPEDEYRFEPENADFRYKEESLYPDFESQDSQFENYRESQREEGRNPDYDDFNFDFPKTEFEEFQEALNKERPLNQEEESEFQESPPYPEPKDFPREILKYEDPSQQSGEKNPDSYNPTDSSLKKKTHIIRPIQTKEPVYSENNFRSPVKPLSTNLHKSHQLIQIPSIDDRFRPIVKDSVPAFTGFDNNQEIITAPPFPKRRFVNSQLGQTFDVKLGAGFNTRDGTPLDTKVIEPITHFSKK